MNEWEKRRELTAQEREIAVEGLNPDEWLSFGDKDFSRNKIHFSTVKAK